jgi:hypothetical protein
MKQLISRIEQHARAVLRKTPVALGVAIVALTALGVPSAHAGDKRTSAVVVNTAGRTASGALGTARSSAGTKQMIGCWGLVMQDTSPGAYSAYCLAVDSAGVTGACTLGDLLSSSSQWNVLQALKEDSYLSFSWTATGVCKDLRVDNYSYWEPLSP